MRKSVFITLSFMVVSLLSGCTPEASQTVSESSSEVSTNGPVFSGVNPEATIHLGETYNALLGVSASDIEDGDLTSQILITSTPALVNNNGFLLPDSQGEYYLTYSVTDSDNLTAEAYATLIVAAPLPVETLYSSLSVAEEHSFALHDWEMVLDESAEALLTTEEELGIALSDSGQTRESVMFTKVLPSLSKDKKYIFEFTLKGEGANVQIRVASEDGDVSLSEAYPLTSELTTQTFEFTPLTDGVDVSVSLLFGNDLVPSLTNLVISRLSLSLEVEAEDGVLLIDDTFSEESLLWDANAYEGAEAVISQDEGLVFTINKYASKKNPWNINLFRKSEIMIKSGFRYRVNLEITSAAEQFFELCIEDRQMDWQTRAAFHEGTLQEGENTIDFTFTASQDINGVYVKLALGRGSAESNVIVIKSLAFSGFISIVTNDVFLAEYSKPDWKVFNTAGGEGNASGKSGALVYTITTFGTVDWHNKIAFENIALDAFAKYRFEVSYTALAPISGRAIITDENGNDLYYELALFESNEESVIAFKLDTMLYEAKTVDFLLQFGSFVENSAPSTITISSVKIYAIK